MHAPSKHLARMGKIAMHAPSKQNACPHARTHAPSCCNTSSQESERENKKNDAPANASSVAVDRFSANTPMNRLALYAVEESERTGVPAEIIVPQLRAGTYRPPPESFEESGSAGRKPRLTRLGGEPGL